MSFHGVDPPYFYGDISRENAELILWDRGCLDGMYLLRSSNAKDADWVLALCHQKSVVHYRIRKLPEGLIGVHGVPQEKFASLADLVRNICGLACKPAIPCNKPLDKLIPNWSYGLKDYDVQAAIKKKLEEWGLKPEDLQSVIADKHSDLYNLVMKTLHESQPWFHGKISRLLAERRLCNSGHSDGKFLVRERDDCSYALCMSHASQVKHYKIDVWSTGELGIQDGPRFDNLVALVSHYTVLSDGLWCSLREPCSKPLGSTCGGDDSSNDEPGPASPSLFAELTKDPAMNETVHRLLPWNQDNPPVMPTEYAESPSIPTSPIIDQVKEADPHVTPGVKKNKPIPAPRHKLPAPQPPRIPPPVAARITRQQSFPVASTFSNEQTEMDPSQVSAFAKSQSSPNLVPLLEELQHQLSLKVRIKEQVEVLQTLTEQSLSDPDYEVVDPDYEEANVVEKLGNSTDGLLAASSTALVSDEICVSKWDDPKDKDKRLSSHGLQRRPTWTREESEDHFKTIRKYRKGPTNIQSQNVVLQHKLGIGNFGEVYKAVFKSNAIEVPFAVKMLKTSVPNAKADILREAHIMTELDHPNIVRLLGICESESLMLVMELAPLGPLNSFLSLHRETPMSDVVFLMLQVVQGMEYLEARQFVHRDLAARNILLVNESFAKISDFGMSRALGLDQDYYKVEPSGKLPLKWYAPECIYYFRFSSKSDVWSYGISLWEATSYGEKPYQGQTGQEILRMFSQGQRLPCPDKCPSNVYDVMLQCWLLKPEDRPTFSELYSYLKQCCREDVHQNAY